MPREADGNDHALRGQGYHDALRLIEALWGAPEGSPAADIADALAALVEAYEEEHFPFDEPSPEAVAQFRREQMGE